MTRLPVLDERPQTRAECRDMPRPCPWVSCRHHLAFEVTAELALAIPGGPFLSATAPADHVEAFADAVIERITTGPSCSLDVADRGEQTLQEVGNAYGVTRERIRQVERSALRLLNLRARVRRLR